MIGGDGISCILYLLAIRFKKSARNVYYQFVSWLVQHIIFCRP